MPYPANKGRPATAKQAAGLKLGPAAAKRARDRRKAEAEQALPTEAELLAELLAGQPEGAPSRAEHRLVKRAAHKQITIEKLEAAGHLEAVARHEDKLDDLLAALEAAGAARVAAATAKAHQTATNPNHAPPEQRRARAAAVYKLLARQGALDNEAREVAVELGHGQIGGHMPPGTGARNDAAHACINQAAQLRAIAGRQTALDVEERVLELEWIRAEKERTDTPELVAEWKAAKAEINQQRERPD